MLFNIVQGRFSREESLEILTQMVNVKIKFHEKKIDKSHNEEDIKMRERSIKQLQKEFYEAKQCILSTGKNCEMEATIKIN